MPENTSPPPEPLACPICRRPLKRTTETMLSAFECEQCGLFTEFKGASERRGGRRPGEPGSDPTD